MQGKGNNSVDQVQSLPGAKAVLKYTMEISAEGEKKEAIKRHRYLSKTNKKQQTITKLGANYSDYGKHSDGFFGSFSNYLHEF